MSTPARVLFTCPECGPVEVTVTGSGVAPGTDDGVRADAVESFAKTWHDLGAHLDALRVAS